LMVNVAEIAPAAMVTCEGRVALVLLDFKLTAVPPDAAGPFRVTVPVEGLPPITVFGDTEMPLSDAESIERTAD